MRELGGGGGGEFRWRVDVCGGGEERGRGGGEACRDPDGESGTGSADNHDAADEPDGDGGTDSDIYSGGGRNRAIELPMAEVLFNDPGSAEIYSLALRDALSR